MKTNQIIIWALTIAIIILPELTTSFLLDYGDAYGYGMSFFQRVILLVALLFLPLPLFHNKPKIYFYLLSPFVLLSPITVFNLYLYKGPLSADDLLLLLETDKQEVFEFLSGYKTIISGAALIIVCTYLFLVSKIKPFSSKKIFIIIYVASLSILLLSSILNRKERSYVNTFTDRASCVYPFTIINITIDCVTYLKKHKPAIDNFKFNAHKNDTLNKRQIFVLVLGESSRYDHWGINGYCRNTSPYLSHYKDLINYSNMCTGALNTRNAVPMIITRANALNFDKCYKEKSVVGAFCEAGFKTYWIGNQNKKIKYDYNIGIHMGEADSVIILENSTNPNDYDENILASFEKIIHTRTDSNLFILIHTKGSHYEYQNRYPNNFDVFKPSTKNTTIRINDASQKDKITNSYDNTILYTDYILDRIIKIINTENVISYVLYVSDHGENLFDTKELLFAHHKKATEFVLKIPMFVWTSDLYESAYAQKQKNLIVNKNKKSTVNNVFYTLLDMANINIDDRNMMNNSLSSANFKEKKRSFIGFNKSIQDCDSLLSTKK